MNLRSVCLYDVALFKDKQIYIYGAGEYARDINRWLEDNGLSVAGFIVDDEYWNNAAPLRTLPWSVYAEEGHDGEGIIVNGIASVTGLRKLKERNISDSIYFLYEPVALWKYDELYFENNRISLNYVESLFCDELSRKTMRAFFKAKQGGDIVDDVAIVSEEETYFNSITKDVPEGAYIDCGAYNGDSVKKYIDFCKRNNKNVGEIWAFEPDRRNYNLLKDEVLGLGNVHCMEKGIFSKQCQLTINQGNDMSSRVGAEISDAVVSVIDIDSLPISGKVAMIKMDIEGGEYDGLVGAVKTIMRDYPVLAISAYHKLEDLIRLPLLIKSFEQAGHGYNFFLRHHGCCAYELVLYAIPRDF